MNAPPERPHRWLTSLLDRVALRTADLDVSALARRTDWHPRPAGRQPLELPPDGEPTAVLPAQPPRGREPLPGHLPAEAPPR